MTEWWTPDMLPPVVLQALAAALVLLVQGMDKLIPKPERISQAVDWMRSILKEKKVNATSNLLTEAMAKDSLAAAHFPPDSTIASTCNDFVDQWEALSEEERQINGAHKAYERWRGRLFFWLVGAAILAILTVFYADKSFSMTAAGGVLLGSEIGVIWHVYNKATFLTSRRKNAKYVKSRDDV